MILRNEKERKKHPRCDCECQNECHKTWQLPSYPLEAALGI